MKISGHGECGICLRRIPSNEFKRKVGTAKLWEKVRRYAEDHGLAIQKQEIICKKCHACINTGKINGIHRLNRNQHQQQEQNLNDGLEDILTDENNNTESENANENEENMDFENSSQSTSENTNSSQSSGSSFNSFTFALPKPIIKLNIPSCSGTQRKCFICGDNDRSRIPKSAIADVWYRKQIMIPMKNRCCKEHWGSDGKFTPEVLEKIVQSKDNITLSSEEVKDFIITITDSHPSTFTSLLDFRPHSSLTSFDYEKLTGLTKTDFEDLHEYCSRLHNSSNRSTRDALAMFLIKLRLNLPQEVIGLLFGTTQEKVSDSIKSVRLCLEETFVPKYLGWKHLTREQAKIHQVMFANKLFEVSEDIFFVIIDATYLYIQKPSDFELQKKTYCMHKKRNLLKPMLIVFPNGYILECSDLFFCDSENNDANILKFLLEMDQGISVFLVENDHFIIDRGFRDVINKLIELNYKPYMPNLLKKSEKQFTTLAANESRAVTMLRWVVEAVNGRLKNKWRMFASVIETPYIPTLGSLFRIGCALLNKYAPPIFTETDDHQKLAESTLARMKQENELRIYVEREELLRKTACWTKASKDDFADFPKLSKLDLKFLTLGVYQIKLAHLYTQMHLAKNSSYVIYFHKELPNLIRAKIESRFTKVQHQLWIKYNPNQNTETGILGWYCLCKVGSRVVGCCSHIASVLWFLGYARYNEVIKGNTSISERILDAAAVLNNNEMVEDSEVSLVGN